MNIYLNKNPSTPHNVKGFPRHPSGASNSMRTTETNILTINIQSHQTDSRSRPSKGNRIYYLLLH